MRTVILTDREDLKSFPDFQLLWCPKAATSKDGRSVCGSWCPFFCIVEGENLVRLYCTGSEYPMKVATEAEIEEEAKKEAAERR